MPWIVIFHWQGAQVVLNDLEHTAGRKPDDLGPEFPERGYGVEWLLEMRNKARIEGVRNERDFVDWLRAGWIKEKANQ